MDKYLNEEETKEVLRKAYKEGRNLYNAFKEYCDSNNIERTEIVMSLFSGYFQEVQKELV